MKKTFRFVSLSIWILFSRAYDAYATYQYTPDLSQEANPLVSFIGLDWLPLLSIIGLLTMYTIYAFYINTFRPFSFVPKEKGFRFSTFYTYIYLGRKTHWSSIFYQLPNSLERFNHYIGYFLSRGLVFAGIVSTIMWLLINYTDFYLSYHRVEAIYAILVLGTLGIILGTKRKWYLEYQQR